MHCFRSVKNKPDLSEIGSMLSEKGQYIFTYFVCIVADIEQLVVIGAEKMIYSTHSSTKKELSKMTSYR